MVVVTKQCKVLRKLHRHVSTPSVFAQAFGCQVRKKHKTARFAQPMATAFLAGPQGSPRSTRLDYHRSPSAAQRATALLDLEQSNVQRKRRAVIEGHYANLTNTSSKEH